MAIDTSKTITKVTYEGVEIPLAGTSGDSGGEYLVQVIDYDGTVLKQDHLDTGATFELPDAPTNHSRLVFQEWSSPVTITDNTITVENSDITIGAVYKTASGLTEFDIELTKVTGLEVTCNMVGNKNWGDGTTDNLTTHTYADYGEYTITCDGIELPQYVFGQSSSIYNYFCKNAYIGELIEAAEKDAFYYCANLKSITRLNIFTGFRNCYGLKSVTIPNGIEDIGIPFVYCYNLISVAIPSSVNSVGSNAFQYCYGLKSVTILGELSSISNTAFDGCNSVRKYDFSQCTSVPTLNANVFRRINALCKIYVPDALYDDWIVATNWVTYADYIYKASEMED